MIRNDQNPAHSTSGATNALKTPPKRHTYDVSPTQVFARIVAEVLVRYSHGHVRVFLHLYSNYDDESCNQTNVISFGAFLTPLFFSIVTILSLFGNILVLVILVKYENLKSLINTFILNLAVSDLLFTAGLPFWAHYHIKSKWILGEPLCIMINFIFYAGFYSSGFLLILMTIHCYVAVMSPLSDFVSATGLSSIIASIIIWFVSILAGSPVFIFVKAKGQGYCGLETSDGRMWGTYQQKVLFILTAVVFVFCYSQIMCRLLHPSAKRRRNKTVKLIFTLMVVFVVGWGPYNAVIFLKSSNLWLQQTEKPTEQLQELCAARDRLDYTFYVSRLLAFSHCCLNPVFYVFLGVKFKTHLKKLLKSWGYRNNSIRNRQSRLTITSHTSGEQFSM
ncbi:chemokine XC receptor 1 [Nothobranchius furzeri]